MHRTTLEWIARETAHARAGRPAGIRAKMNALVDPRVIGALYEASQAGVTIDLAVRGICCLKPGVPGLSETVRVRSIVGRFLEHSRVFVFENGGERQVWLSSADWMPRNFFQRVEIAFPVEDPELAGRAAQAIDLTLSDNVRARDLKPDGTYLRLSPAPGEAAVDTQAALLDDARARMQRAVERVARGGADGPDGAETGS